MIENIILREIHDVFNLLIDSKGLSLLIIFMIENNNPKKILETDKIKTMYFMNRFGLLLLNNIKINEINIMPYPSPDKTLKNIEILEASIYNFLIIIIYKFFFIKKFFIVNLFNTYI